LKTKLFNSVQVGVRHLIYKEGLIIFYVQQEY